MLLQNIHLTIDWTNGPLEKTVDKLAEGAHEDFRVFLSAEPPAVTRARSPSLCCKTLSSSPTSRRRG